MSLNFLDKKIFFNLLRIRLVEQEIANEYSKWQMRCPVHLSIGQELVSACLQTIWRKSDYVVSSHRAHAHYLAKNGSLKKMIAEIYGKSTGCSSGKGGSMHLIDQSKGFMGSTAIVANTIPIGVGLGLSIKYKKKNSLSFICLGDATIETGVFFESLNFSIIKELPVVYICENNSFSVYTEINERQPKNRKIHKFVEKSGIKTFFSDGLKPREVHNKILKAVNYSRKYKKPSFVEIMTFRYREHVGPNYDNHLNYRSKKYINYWKSKDHLNFFKKEISHSELTLKQNLIKKEINKAFKFASKSSFPKKKDLSTHLFKNYL
jgi:TPP-dependent pyruvate/acetoin dehydrogenase alpha subunit